MIQLFLGQEKRNKKSWPASAGNSTYSYKYIYFYDVVNSRIDILNPWTRELRRTDNGSMVELYYKDDFRERIHKHLISWSE